MSFSIVNTLLVLFKNGRVIIFTIDCKCWKYVFNTKQYYITLEIHISFQCILEELNGHSIPQDSSPSTFQCPRQAHVPDLAVSYDAEAE